MLYRYGMVIANAVIRIGGHMSSDKHAEILKFIHSLNSANAAVKVDTDLIATGALDSLSVMELIAFLSDYFKITIPASDVTPTKLKSVVTLAALVEARET
jgi:acyl carrier protein